MNGFRKAYRRTAVAALALYALCCLTACTGRLKQQTGGENGGSVNQSGQVSAAERVQEILPQKLIKVGFVQVGHESDWRIASTKSCKKAFSEENGYELYFVDADNDPKLQTEAVRNFIQDQVDYIVIDPILTTGWDAVLTEAYHAHIPVILLDRTIDCDERYYTAWYGSDFVKEGEYAGQWLEDYLHRNGRGSETIHIAAINGTPGASAQLGRTEGFAKYVDQNKNWHLLAEKSGDFTENGGRQVMKEYLEKYPGLDVVVCQNDNEALGACSALEEAGVSYGKDGEVILISFDATRAGLQAVLDGKIHADFECNPLSPLFAAGAVQRLEAGGTLQKKNYMPEDCFTFEEGPVILTADFGVKQMITVTSELIEGRFY